MTPMISKKFGRLTVLSCSHTNRSHFYVCVCECGQTKTVNGMSLRSGGTKSCGCLQREHGYKQGKANIRHGLEGTLTYQVWCGMIQRCTNPNSEFWNRYGGRGIKVCSRWSTFEAFYADMGPKPDGLTLDRKNNEGDYTPDNCRWASRHEQAVNRSSTKLITRDGKTMCLYDWCAATGVSSGSVYTIACATGQPHQAIFERLLARKNQTNKNQNESN